MKKKDIINEMIEWCNFQIMQEKSIQKVYIEHNEDYVNPEELITISKAKESVFDLVIWKLSKLKES